MRNLGSEYEARMLSELSQPRVRVTVTGWGGSPDPYDLSPYVLGASVERSVRGGMGRASLEIDDSDGRFDVIGGADREVLALNNGTIAVEFGEQLLADALATPSGEAYWQMWVGGVVDRAPRQDAVDRSITVSLGPRGNDLEGRNITSRQYGGEGVTPATWQANDIVKDLFEAFAGFTDPDDFDLAALDFEIEGLQFEGQSLWETAGQCLLPRGYRLWVGYDGRLKSGLLLPTSWTPTLTIAAIAVEQPDIADAPPEATRIFVGGGPGASSAVIHEEQKWAASRFAYDYPAGNFIVGGGDCYKYTNAEPLPLFYYQWMYYMAGPKGQKFRRSEIRNVQQALCVGGLCATGGFLTEPYIVSEWWNPDEERMECKVYWNLGDNPDLWIDFSFEVWGHPYEFSRPEINVQAWDDDLIVAWGERPRQLNAPAATTYPLAQDVATRELVFAQKSVRRATINIKGLDLRVEPGDVATIVRESGDFDLWVQQVAHGIGADGGKTMLQGYAL